LAKRLRVRDSGSGDGDGEGDEGNTVGDDSSDAILMSESMRYGIAISCSFCSSAAVRVENQWKELWRVCGP